MWINIALNSNVLVKEAAREVSSRSAHGVNPGHEKQSTTSLYSAKII